MLVNESLARTFLDRETVPQHKLDIAERIRTNLIPWPGQFSPQLVAELLSTYGENSGTIMDPFVGSGTSLVEAARLGKAAWGIDINPAAAILSRVYCLTNLGIPEREAALENFEQRLFHRAGPFVEPLFAGPPSTSPIRDAYESSLVKLWAESDTEVSRILAAALVVLCDFYREHLDANHVSKVWFRLCTIVRSLPASAEPIVVCQADARALPSESDSVDLIVTSPPYINVHNYHQHFRRSVEALGWNVLSIAQSEIGSNRQNRQNRFVTVIQYALDMALAIREMARVARPGARLILVVGRESTVRRVPFFNGEFVAELAVKAIGLNSDRRQERQFINRYGKKIREDILHYSSTLDLPDKEDCLEAARVIAHQTLSATRDLTTDSTREGINDALERIDFVSPSPFPHNGDR